MSLINVTYTGNGATVLFSIPFPYLSPGDIEVLVNGSQTTAFTFANATTIQFNVAPINGAAILIQRVTDPDIANRFFPNSSIPSDSLNDNFQQSLYVAEEAREIAKDAQLGNLVPGSIGTASLADGAVTSNKIADGTIVDGDINASAAIVDTKLATIATAGKVSNSATTATSSNTVSAIVARDGSGNFSAGTITAALTGNADTATKLNSSRTFAVTGDITGTVSSDLTSGASIATSIASGVIVNDDVNASAAIAGTKISPDFGSQNIVTTGTGTFGGDVTIPDKIIHAGDTDTAIRFPAADVFAVETAGSERCRVDASGRLLVGTSTDVSNGLSYTKLQVVDSKGSALTLATSETSIVDGEVIGEIRFYGNSGNTAAYGQFARIDCVADGTASSNADNPGRLVFSTTADGASSPTERMRIRADGLNATFCAATTDGHVISSAASAGTTNYFIDGLHSASGILSGTRSFRVFTNGNVQNTNNSYGSLSDIKLKENIVDASSQWDDLKALQVRNYNFKEGQTHTQIGLIAQEVELVSPGLVTESPDRDEDGNETGEVTKSVNYSVLYMKAVKALQEAMERIEALEAEVTALKAQ